MTCASVEAQNITTYLLVAIGCLSSLSYKRSLKSHFHKYSLPASGRFIFEAGSALRGDYRMYNMAKSEHTPSKIKRGLE